MSLNHATLPEWLTKEVEEMAAEIAKRWGVTVQNMRDTRRRRNGASKAREDLAGWLRENFVCWPYHRRGKPQPRFCVPRGSSLCVDMDLIPLSWPLIAACMNLGNHTSAMCLYRRYAARQPTECAKTASEPVEATA